MVSVRHSVKVVQSHSSEKGRFVLESLRDFYPSIRIALNFSNPWELLVATILSAQCTDNRVNQVTKVLFQKYKTISEYAVTPIFRLERIIYSCGFFRSKAKNIKSSARKILDQYGGIVPRTMEELVTLSGVGRKTANVLLFNAFQKNEGIAVDTHVKRITKLLGLTQSVSPEMIEQDLMKIFPRNQWGKINHRLVQYGRDICISRRPQCHRCVLVSQCDDYQKIK